VVGVRGSRRGGGLQQRIGAWLPSDAEKAGDRHGGGWRRVREAGVQGNREVTREEG
jgi:hypothetical protein